MTIHDLANWRFATKKYDAAKKVSATDLDYVLEAIRMAPTSNGFQPFDVLVVENENIRAKLQGASFGQPQIVEASHVIVFAAWATINADNLGKVFDNFETTRGVSESLAERRKSTIAGLSAKSDEQHFQHAAQQAFIGLGFGLLAAADRKIDATPMGGFNAGQYDEILGLGAMGLRSCVVMALGYRAAEGDWLEKLPKVRRSRQEMIHTVK